MLNLGILAIAWFKAWRPLNVAGFLFTFVIGTAWGVLRYKPDLFASTEPFLIGFFLLYVAIAILFSLRQQPVLRGYVDGTIVFGTPAVAFGLQTAMVHDWKFALAYSAVAVSALYLVLAWFLYRGKRETQRLLVEAFMALGVTFLTLAVPLALDGRWSAATWALEGAALVWVGCRQNRRLPRVSGVLLQIASGVIFLFDVDAPYSSVPVLNSACLGGLMIAVASVFACRALIKARDSLADYESVFAPMLFFWGLIWWLIAGITEIGRHLDARTGSERPDILEYTAAWIFVFLSLTALISSELHRRLDIRVARLPPFMLLPVMLSYAALTAAGLGHPLAEGGWIAWPVAFAIFYFLCRRFEKDGANTLMPALHAGSALLLVALVSWEFAWQVNEGVNGSGSWPAIAWAIIPAAALFLLPKLCARFAWPFAAHRETYVAVVGSVLALYVALWSLGTNFSMRGDPYPLPYVPLLNPLDIAQVFVLLVLARHGLHVHKTRYRALAGVEPTALVWILAALVFVWLNAVLLRTIHHWAQVPFELEELFRSTLVQTALTIFWTVLALATMLFATRRSTRLVWIAGAVLMGIVIGKLFLIDLSRIGTVERIVSFVGVGLLMLVVGYFSPLPPAQKADRLKRALAAMLALGVMASAHAAEVTPADFALGMKVVTSGEAAGYRASLPLAVYQNAVRADLGDVRVFNGRGEVVPFAIERPKSQAVPAQSAAPMSLPVFTLRGDPVAALDAVRVTIAAGDTTINVAVPGALPDAGPIRSYLVDARSLDGAMSVMQVEWSPDAADFAGRLQVEASDDLDVWRTVESAAPIANLHAGEAKLIEHRIELPAIRARFWRLTWTEEAAPFEITSVTAELARGHVDVERASLEVAGRPVEASDGERARRERERDDRDRPTRDAVEAETVTNVPGEFTFDLGAQLPVDRVNLELPEQNTIVEITLFSRAGTSDALARGREQWLLSPARLGCGSREWRHFHRPEYGSLLARKGGHPWRRPRQRRAQAARRLAAPRRAVPCSRRRPVHARLRQRRCSCRRCGFSDSSFEYHGAACNVRRARNARRHGAPHRNCEID